MDGENENITNTMEGIQLMSEEDKNVTIAYRRGRKGILISLIKIKYENFSKTFVNESKFTFAFELEILYIFSYFYITLFVCNCCIRRRFENKNRAITRRLI